MPQNHNNKQEQQQQYADPPIPPSLRPTSFLSNPIQFTASWVLVLVALPFVIPFILSLHIYRQIIRTIARYRANLTVQLTPYDSIFAVDSYHTRPYASNLTVLELKSRVSVETVRNLFTSRILSDKSFEKLTWVPTEYISYWFWSQHHPVDIEHHVRVFYDSELDNSGGGKTVDQCLQEIIEMPYKNLLFNVFVLHFGSQSYVVFRIHHTVCDGYSFNHLIDKFVGLESRYLVKAQQAQGLHHIGIRQLYQLAVKWVTLLLHIPLHIITLFCESVTHRPNFYTVRKRSTTGLIRRTILPLSSIKQIRSSTNNSHVASIGMSLMTGALQKHYDSDKLSTSNPPYLRPKRLAIMHSLPKPNHPLTTLCNHWGVGLFKIPFIQDPVARMYSAEEDFREYTALGFDTVLHIHIPIVGLIPTFVVKWFFSLNFGTSCGFTSVPGLFDRVAYLQEQDQEYYYDGLLVGGNTRGIEVAHMWKVFGLQWRQSAVAVAMYTYRGEASVSFYANSDIIPDNQSMDRLMELFHEEFNQLLSYSNTTAPQTQQQASSPLNTTELDISGTSKFLEGINATPPTPPRNNKLA